MALGGRDSVDITPDGLTWRHYEHRDVLMITGWTPIEWRCKHCHKTAETIMLIDHEKNCELYDSPSSR